MSEFDMPAEVIDSATEEGQARIAELKAASAAEKTRRKRRSEAQLISDGILEIKRRFDALAQEMVDSSLEAAIDRGEVVRADEVERRIKKARQEAREEIRKLLQDDNK